MVAAVISDGTDRGAIQHLAGRFFKKSTDQVWNFARAICIFAKRNSRASSLAASISIAAYTLARLLYAFLLPNLQPVRSLDFHFLIVPLAPTSPHFSSAFGAPRFPTRSLQFPVNLHISIFARLRVRSL